MATDKVYCCDRCGQDTPEGDGKHYNGDRFCPDCAEVVAFWETIEHDDESEVTA
jgi:formylmethanofuran dehydrogenase subunit E